jgi:hypothetical protein
VQGIATFVPNQLERWGEISRDGECLQIPSRFLPSAGIRKFGEAEVQEMESVNFVDTN